MSMRGLRIVLAISILLNLFLIGGAVAGGYLLHRRLPMIGAGTFRAAGADLPADERRAFRMALRETRRDALSTIEAGHQARREAAALLVQPQLDQPATIAALSRVRAADFALRAQLDARAVAFAATLPAGDRAALAQSLLRRPGRGGRGRPD